MKKIKFPGNAEVKGGDTIVRYEDHVNLPKFIEKLSEYNKTLCGPEVGGDTICRILAGCLYDQDEIDIMG